MTGDRHWLQAAPGCAETHWIFVGCLVLARQVAAAVQVTYHGHAVGALRHYKPYISALNQADSQQVPPRPRLLASRADPAPQGQAPPLDCNAAPLSSFDQKP